MKMIACVDNNWAIGKGDKLLFNIKEDIEFFKEATRYSPALVVGRSTYETLPVIDNIDGKDIRGLKGRCLFVVSSKEDSDIPEDYHKSSIPLIESLQNNIQKDIFKTFLFDSDVPLNGPCTHIMHSKNLDDILHQKHVDKLMVIGGESIYKQCLGYCDTAYITKVLTSVEDADKYIDNLDENPDWILISESDIFRDINTLLNYKLCLYVRRDERLNKIQNLIDILTDRYINKENNDEDKSDDI